MKNPGWANNRGSPPYISRNSSYQIPLSAKAPAVMILKPRTACSDEDGSQSAACVQISTFLSRCLHLFAAGAAIFNVRGFRATGAKADNATGAIQRAIDACAQAGGMVYLPPDEYTSGTLHLRSHVRFHIEGGATL
jgi:polygalacturonase